MIDPASFTDEELQAWVMMFEFIIAGRQGSYEWASKDQRSDEIMHGYHNTWRECALDLLAYKGVIDGPTNGKYNIMRR